MGEGTDRKWVELYEAALLETDLRKLQAVIEEAQAAVQKRVQELLAQADRHAEERRALADALQNLRVLRRERL